MVVGLGLAPTVSDNAYWDTAGAFINRKAIYRRGAVAGNNAVDRAPALQFVIPIIAFAGTGDNLQIALRFAHLVVMPKN